MNSINCKEFIKKKIILSEEPEISVLSYVESDKGNVVCKTTDFLMNGTRFSHTYVKNEASGLGYIFDENNKSLYSPFNKQNCELGISVEYWFMKKAKEIKEQIQKMQGSKVTSTLKAKVVTLHHNDDFRLIMELEGESSQYYCGPKESSKYVQVQKVDLTDLYHILCSIEIVLLPEKSDVMKVAEKFRTEICSQKDGLLCYKHSPNSGFYKIIE